MKTDRRVRYTKTVIRESLLKLLHQKPIQKITVKEICELAELNRATFYSHYRDAYDVLEQIENELFEDLSSMVTTRRDVLTGLTNEIFEVIEKNLDLCQVLFSENGDKMFLRRTMDVAREKSIVQWQQQYPQATRSHLDDLYTFVVSGATAVIEQWVRTGRQERPIELNDIARKVGDIWLAEVT